MANCLICGAELVDGLCPSQHIVKPMCLNCMWVQNGENEYRCVNEAVLQIARDKMLAALPDGYEVESLQLKPMLLKNPCKKCTNYEMNKTIVIETLLAPSGLSIKDIVE